VVDATGADPSTPLVRAAALPVAAPPPRRRPVWRRRAPRAPGDDL